MSQPTPNKQNILLLHAAKQDYEHTEEAPVPQIQSENDVLLQTKVIGLNPIDWKGPYACGEAFQIDVVTDSCSELLVLVSRISHAFQVANLLVLW